MVTQLIMHYVEKQAMLPAIISAGRILLMVQRINRDALIVAMLLSFVQI